jgi:hypothetical protein
MRRTHVFSNQSSSLLQSSRPPGPYYGPGGRDDCDNKVNQFEKNMSYSTSPAVREALRAHPRLRGLLRTIDGRRAGIGAGGSTATRSRGLAAGCWRIRLVGLVLCTSGGTLKCSLPFFPFLFSSTISIASESLARIHSTPLLTTGDPLDTLGRCTVSRGSPVLLHRLDLAR